MKTVTVYAKKYQTQLAQPQTVQFHNFDEDAPLTPALARAAARLAFGNDEFKTVCDDSKCYRITSNHRTRLLSPLEPDYDSVF